MKKILLIFSTLFVCAQHGHAGDNTFYQLKLNCSSKIEVKGQPCGGTNLREISLDLVGTHGEYQEERAYGGCYGVNDQGFGEIRNIQKKGKVVTFELVRLGYYDRTEPVLNRRGGYQVMDATLSLDTLKLALNTSNLPWFYRLPSTLDCVFRD